MDHCGTCTIFVQNSPMHTYSHLLFDLDGTLTDSMPGITRCVQLALSHFGIIVNDLQRLRPFVGPPLRDSFQEIYHLTDAQTEEAIGIYQTHYDTCGLFENEVYDGIPRLLDALQNHGYHLSIATSKPAPLAERVLEHFDLRKYFGTLCGGEPDGPRRTKAGVIENALTINVISDRNRALMIGDRKHDIQGAHANGIDSVGVLWGYGGIDELKAYEATYLVRNADELIRLLLPGTVSNY